MLTNLAVKGKQAKPKTRCSNAKDNDWKPFDSRTFRFVRIKPGHYRYRSLQLGIHTFHCDHARDLFDRTDNLVEMLFIKNFDGYLD